MRWRQDDLASVVADAQRSYRTGLGEVIHAPFLRIPEPLAFRIGEFSKEPIAGVTPIADMLEINALDKSPAEEAASNKLGVSIAGGKTSAPGDATTLPSSTQDYASILKPIDTPLIFNGFSEDTMRRFATQFGSAGIVPVMGAGSVSEDKQPDRYQRRSRAGGEPGELLHVASGGGGHGSTINPKRRHSFHDPLHGGDRRCSNYAV